MVNKCYLILNMITVVQQSNCKSLVARNPLNSAKFVRWATYDQIYHYRNEEEYRGLPEWKYGRYFDRGRILLWQYKPRGVVQGLIVITKLEVCKSVYACERRRSLIHPLALEHGAKHATLVSLDSNLGHFRILHWCHSICHFRRVPVSRIRLCDRCRV